MFGLASCVRGCRAHNATLRAGLLPGGGILPDAQVGLLLVLHLAEEGLEHLLLVVANELVDLLELVGLLVLHPPLLEARHRHSLLGGHHDGVVDVVELGGRGQVDMADFSSNWTSSGHSVIHSKASRALFWLLLQRLWPEGTSPRGYHRPRPRAPPRSPTRCLGVPSS